jgi:excisionase family DNA binding protein
VENESKQQYLSIKEVAEITGIKQVTWRKWIAAQRIAHVRLGRAIRIPRAALEKLITQNTVTAVDEDPSKPEMHCHIPADAGLESFGPGRRPNPEIKLIMQTRGVTRQRAHQIARSLREEAERDVRKLRSSYPYDLDSFDLRKRPFGPLYNAGFNTLAEVADAINGGQFKKYSKPNKKLRNFGQKSLEEVKRILIVYGFQIEGQ